MASISHTATTTARELRNGHPLESTSVNGGSSRSSRQQQSSGRHRGATKYKHTFAVHSESRTSRLSHDAPAPPAFSGFRNLMGLVLVFSNLRLMIENVKKYGILVTFSGSKIRQGDWVLLCSLYLMVPCHLFLAYLIEMMAARYAKEKVIKSKKANGKHNQPQAEREKRSLFSTWRVIACAHGLNATAMLVYATFAVYYGIHNPGLAAFSEFHAVIVWLKVCSYAFTNRDLRHAYVNADPTDPPLPSLYKACMYPNNITLGNLCYFWWAPTLVYQPVYPRTKKIRWDFVARRAGEAFLLCIVIWVACAQYAVPLLQNSLKDISQLHWINMLERTLKLSTISLVCWLAGFFALFQSFLNLLAELLMFGDREFYGDWWNSAGLRSYWTSWNKPVTQFMKRHIYSPMVGRGVPPMLAQLITFLFSGVLHELLVGVPTHNILGVAFLGMVGQIPLIYITDPLSRTKGHNAKLAGNLIFWATFCFFGQPIAALAYFFAWQAKYGVESRPEWPVALKV